MYQSTVARKVSHAKLLLGFIFICSCSSLNAKTLDPFEARQAPIDDFVEWVSEQSGHNIIVGRGVEGSVSVHVKNLESDDVMKLFNQVMQSNGYMVKEESGLYKVVVDSDQVVVTQPVITKLYTLQHLRNTRARDVFNSILLSNVAPKNTENTLAQAALSKHSVDILPASNALLVSATNSQLMALDSFVSQIDMDVSQVLIEAVIIESDLGNSKAVGINLSTALRENGFSLLTTTVNNITDLSMLGQGSHMVYRSGGDIRSFITAITKNEDTKILSTPRILVIDREQGHISVGQNVPFVVSREVTDGGNSIQQIQRNDVGVTLSVRPHVLASGDIILNIQQESSSISNSIQAADIITNKRSISTVAKVRDGQTLSLGGLVNDETRISKSGIPILKSIPWLGRLFRSESSETVQRELTVMITTTIL